MMTKTTKTPKTTRKNNQLNNGFTLLEVLIAVIILAIVCIPVFRAFVTSANTTAKSKLKMRATNAAENIMEDIQHLTIEELQAKYGTMAAMSPGDAGYNVNAAAVGKSKASYKITLNTSDPLYDTDLNKVLDEGYVATIILDPSWYTNTNRVNMPEFSAVSTSTAAIYSMSPNLEKEVCKFFADKNEEYRKTHTTAKVMGESDFPSKIRREIRVDIADKGGYVLDDDGNQVPKVTVDLSVSYLVSEDNLMDDAYRTKKAVSRQIFSSAVTKKQLNSIFVMYEPMYDCDDKYSDIIIVHNRDNVEANLYICAQNIEADSEKFKDYIAPGGNDGLILEIYENEITDASGVTKQPLTLRTNVIDSAKVEYLRDETKSSDEAHIIPISAYVNVGASSSDPAAPLTTIFNPTTYNKIVGKKGSFADKADSKKLNAQCLDGKTLDASTIEDRIYDVRVKVEKPSTGADTEWPVSVELTGSYVPEVKED